MEIVDEILLKFSSDKSLYIGEKVTISEHMIQSAMLAEKTNSSDDLICASLLHDYGHFIIANPNKLVSDKMDGGHEEVGAKYLKKYFVDSIIEPIALHVSAKKYLCRNKNYLTSLSNASKVSLELQGGIMNDEESLKFEKNHYFKNAIQLRKFDESAKKENLKIKKIEDYKDLLISKTI